MFIYAGKAKKKLERVQRHSIREAIATGKVDLDMADAADPEQQAT